MKNYYIYQTIQILTTSRKLSEFAMDEMSKSRSRVLKTNDLIIRSKAYLKSTDAIMAEYSGRDYFLYNLFKPVTKRRQGFALMSIDRLKNVSSKGGKISGESRREDRAQKSITKNFSPDLIH